MIKIKIIEIMKEQEKSLYWLAQVTELSYPTIHRLATGKTQSISFHTLEMVCRAFKVDVCDVLEIFPPVKK